MFLFLFLKIKILGSVGNQKQIIFKAALSVIKFMPKYAPRKTLEQIYKSYVAIPFRQI